MKSKAFRRRATLVAGVLLAAVTLANCLGGNQAGADQADTNQAVPEECGRYLNFAVLTFAVMYDYKGGVADHFLGNQCHEAFSDRWNAYATEWFNAYQPPEGWYAWDTIVTEVARQRNLRTGNEWGIYMAHLRDVNDTSGLWDGQTNCWTTDRQGRAGLLYVEQWNAKRSPTGYPQRVIRADIYPPDAVEALSYMMQYFTRCAEYHPGFAVQNSVGSQDEFALAA